jgi:tripartite-type tricarboxylate transporter receptor subunit TctC
MNDKLNRTRHLVLGSTLIILLLSLLFTNFLRVAEAAEYPSKPIQMMVGYPPGGGSDVFARLVVDKVSALLGQPVVVVNKPGGAGATCAYYTSSAPADGYNIMVVAAPMFLAPYNIKGVTYDIVRDFIPITVGTLTPVTISVGKDHRLQTFEELVAFAKKNPGKLSYAASGYGITWLGMEMVRLQAGLDITHVNMAGTGEIIPAVMGGHVDIVASDTGMANQIRGGGVRCLMVMSEERLKEFPNIPTSVEKGYPALSSFQAVVVKKGTPQPIIDKLEKVFQEALSDKEVTQKFEKMGQFARKANSRDGIKYFSDVRDHFHKTAKILNIVPR